MRRGSYPMIVPTGVPSSTFVDARSTRVSYLHTTPGRSSGGTPTVPRSCPVGRCLCSWALRLSLARAGLPLPSHREGSRSDRGARPSGLHMRRELHPGPCPEARRMIRCRSTCIRLSPRCLESALVCGPYCRDDVFNRRDCCRGIESVGPSVTCTAVRSSERWPNEHGSVLLRRVVIGGDPCSRGPSRSDRGLYAIRDRAGSTISL